MSVLVTPSYQEMNMSEEEIRNLAASRERLNIRLTNDFAFKTTFHNKAALTGLLSALLEIDPAEIRDLEFKDTTLAGEYPEDKTGILDVRLLLNGDRKINIEIQVLPYQYWEERSLFYLSKHFVEGLKKGMDYGLLNTTIHISILAFPLFEDGNWFSVIEFRDRKTHRLYSDKLSLRVLQLSQLSKATQKERRSEVYAWAQMISAEDWEVLKKMAERNGYMKAAVDEMEKINADEEKRYRYLMREKWEHDQVTVRQFEREQGIKQGIKQGIDQGIKQGIEQGIIQGKIEDILEILEELDDMPEKLHKTISEQRNPDILKKWHKLAIRAASLEEFEHEIEN